MIIIHWLKDHFNAVPLHTLNMNIKCIFILGMIVASIQSLNLQGQTFDEDWKIINTELDSGKVKTAEPLIKELFSKAKKAKNSQMMLKSILHLSVLTGNAGDIDDRNIIISIIQFRDSVETDAEKALLHIYTAQALKNYLHYHISDIQQRSYEEFSDNDYTTLQNWTQSQFLKAISYHIKKALNNPGLLLSIPARSYSELLNVKEGSDIYRPTLFDILTHTAISLYESLEQDLSQDDRPVCTDPRLFIPSTEFLDWKPEDIKGFDLSNGTLKERIVLYQELMRNHLSDRQRSAFIDANIQRVLGLSSGFQHPFEDSLIVGALVRIGNESGDNVATPNALYEAALYYSNNEQNKQAITYCNEVIKKFPGSMAAEQCLALMDRLDNKSLDVTIQKQIIPNRPFIFRTSYTNVEKIFCRIYQLNEQLEKKFKKSRYRDMFWDESGIQALMETQPVQAWKQELPKIDDYRGHSTWKKGPALKSGKYIMLLSNVPVYKEKEDNVIVYSEFFVSPITATMQKEHSGGIHLHVMDSEQGSPLKATVHIIESVYDRTANTYTDVITDTFQTNELGSVFVPPVKQEVYVYDRSFRIITQSDTLDIDQSVNRYANRDKEEKERVHIFTDRSIYRPGQLIHFKGIIYKEEVNDNASVMPQQKLLIRLRDARNKTIDSIVCISNEYGSVSGSFTIPNHIVTGYCSLQSDIGGTSMKIEEYKRPTFEVQFKGTNNPILGEDILLHGSVQSFSGATLSGAKVRYSVKRNTMIYPSYYRYLHHRESSIGREIARGQAIVDAMGDFSIQFNAEPDPKQSTENAESYTYSISVDVIASNGELQRADTAISVGTMQAFYQFKHRRISSPSTAKDVFLQCTLNNGKPATGMKGTITVESLINNPLKLPLPFEFGDMDGISDNDKEVLFPFDQFKQQDEQSYRTKSIVYSKEHTSDQFGMIKPILPSLNPGRYRIRFVSENETIPYTLESTWSVIEETTSTMPIDEHLLLHSDKQSFSVGDTAKYIIGSSWNNASILLQIESKGNIISQKRIQCSQSMNVLTLPIISIYRGGVSIHATMIKQGRAITKTLFMNVPWKEKIIQIQTSALRDKTTPGAKEKWTFSVKHPLQKSEMEIMGIVYDASLDPLQVMNTLSIPDVWKTYNAQSQPSSLTDGTQYGYPFFGKRWNETKYQSGLREFDELNVDLLLGGIFGRTEMMYFSDMVKATRMSGYHSLSASHINQSLEDNTMEMEDSDTEPPQIMSRKAFQETALFSPALPFKEGIATLSLTMPDALTKWNIRLFAHAKDVSFGSLDTFIISQKPFMVSTHVPRFLRVGDNIDIKAMIHSLESEETIPLEAFLHYYIDDDTTNITKVSMKSYASKTAPGLASWTISIPKGKTIHLTIGAKSENMNDAESYTLPILPNKELVMDRYPIWIDGAMQQGTEVKLEETSDIESVSYSIATEPFWFAAESLPDLLKPGFGSTLDHIQRMLASQLAQSYIISNPLLQSVVKDSSFTGRLRYNSEQFEDAEIGPWESDMLQQDDQARHVNVYAHEDELKLIFESALQSLQTMQSSEGGFPWFSSMPANSYITRHILVMLGMIDKLEDSQSKSRDMSYMIGRAIQWLDDEQSRMMELALKQNMQLDSLNVTLSDIHYFYARSFFLKQYPLSTDVWVQPLIHAMWNKRMSFGTQAEAMIALLFNRLGDKQKSDAMLRSLQERSIQDKQGIHWPMNSTSWYDADIETHALLLLAFQEIHSESQIAQGIITYILRQKQTRNWKSRSATMSAVMSLLSMSKQCSGNANNVSISINEKQSTPTKTVFPGLQTAAIDQPSGVKSINVSVKGSCPVWGGAFRTRFVDLSDMFSTSDQGLQVKRAYFRKVTQPESRIIPINDGESIGLGETIMIRIQLFSPIAINYVHIQDLFPGCFDLMANNSEYRHYQMISAYIIPQDIGINFFVDYLPKGQSMLEYEVKVDKAGIFSKGMVKAYSVFAPEYGCTKGGGKVVITP